MTSRTNLNSITEETSGRMLGPSAYSDALLPSLRLAESSRFARRIGKTLLYLLVIGLGFVAIAPWQQSVKGYGNVIAFAPGERQQTIEAPIKGRVVKWGENVFENAHVTKGELIAEIQDIDAGLMGRLEFTIKAQVKALETLHLASQRNTETKRDVVISQKALLKTYELAKEEVVASAEAKIAGAKNKVQAERRQLEEVEAALTQIEADFARQKQLFEEEIVAGVKFQLAERKYLEAKAKVEKSQAYIEFALNDQIGKERDRNAKEQKAQGEIDYAKSQLDKAKGDVLKAETEVAKAKSELSKARKTMSEMDTKLARQQNQNVIAPFDGFLTSINANQGGQILKVGDTLCVIVPDTKDRAVQVWLDGNDAPLVQPGRHVRLQFEGWPAVQFAGWPSVAVGTFGGRIVSVDATDNGKGKFRVLVLPDDKRHGWPDERYLRQGVRTNAWVLLEQVPLWYEIWRNLNGFPPVVTDSGDGKDKPKKPKLPK